MTDTTVQ